MREGRSVVKMLRHVPLEDLGERIEELRPDVVAIDSPPSWGVAGRSRRAEGLASTDQVDATLAALTGAVALEGGFTAVGDPEEGVIVLPVDRLPREPFLPTHLRDAEGTRSREAT